jgi:hypothetical protein
VATSVKVNFGLVLSRQRIECWHPERRAGAKLGKHWRDVFYEVRARWVVELNSIGIACPAYRLKMLDRMAQRAEDMGNLALAARIIEQAAREVGAGQMHATTLSD